jgi:hypothetical protein
LRGDFGDFLLKDLFIFQQIRRLQPRRRHAGPISVENFLPNFPPLSCPPRMLRLTPLLTAAKKYMRNVFE